MRSVGSIQSDFINLGKIFDKYLQIAKIPHTFGTGVTLYPTEIHMICTIHDHAGATVTELAKVTGVTKGAISQTVAKLEAKGMIRRETPEDNHLKSLLWLTDLGRRANKAHTAFHLEHDKEFLTYLSTLSEHDYDMFLKLCAQMGKWMDKYLE